MLDKISNSHSPLTNIQVKQGESPKAEDNPTGQQDKIQQEQLVEKTEKVMNSMNDFLKASNSHLKFQFHEKLQEYYVTLIDDSTNEVIKEIPSKKLLDMYASMTEFLGHLVDRKV